MSGLIYLNGILVDAKEAVLPVTDRAYLYGEGLFETMKATQGFIPFLSEHLDRFFFSLPALDFHPKISREELEHAAYQTLRQNHLQEAYLRIQLSRENEAFGSLTPSERYNLLIVAQALKKDHEALGIQGAAAVLFPDYTVRASPLTGIKSTNYAVQLRAKAFAKSHGAHEAIFADATEHLVEGASSNFFLWNGRAWLTPPLNNGPLPGVTRRVLMMLLKQNQVPCEERSISIHELAEAEEAILSNAIWEVLPLTQWEGRAIGSGRVGEKTKQLQQWLAEEIKKRGNP